MYKHMIENLSFNQVGTDPRVNTRPVDTAWVERKHSEGFRPEALGIPSVSYRVGEGWSTYIFLDGQHRAALALRNDYKTPIPMNVYYGLTLAQEADLFLKLNDFKNIKPIYKLIARINAEDPQAVGINTVLTTYGWTLRPGGGPCVIECASALDRIANQGVLKPVIHVVTKAWHRDPDSNSGTLLKGVALFIKRFPDHDPDLLIKALRRYPGGAGAVRAKGIGWYQSGVARSSSEGVARMVHSIYNSGRRANRLTEW